MFFSHGWKSRKNPTRNICLTVIPEDPIQCSRHPEFRSACGDAHVWLQYDRILGIDEERVDSSVAKVPQPSDGQPEALCGPVTPK